MRDFGYGVWEVTCPDCGEKRFLRAHKYKDGRIRGENAICQQCRGKRLEKKVDVICPGCGKSRSLKEADAKQRLSPFCSVCVKKTNRRRENNGRHSNLTSRGYVSVIGMKGHPLSNKSQQVPEHWIVLYEQHPMGADAVIWFKKNGFTVHHKNGERSDNRLENLELRAPGNHPRGWTIEEMKEAIRVYEERN